MLFGSKAHVSQGRWKEGANMCPQVAGISGNDEDFLLLNDNTDLTSFLRDNSL